MISKAKVGESLGRGGQSEVFEVTIDQHYALKVLILPEFDVSKSSTPNLSSKSFTKLQNLLREYEILSYLNHPNIIRVFGFSYGDQKHRPSILLQLCSKNLKESIREMNDIQKVCAIFEICSAMEAIHAADLIHRDLIPENILIDIKGHVRICDFGVAILVSLKDQTHSKSIIGTLGYMAPELLKEDKHYTNKVDIYAFGVVMYFILMNGKLPKISTKDRTNGKIAEIPREINEVSRGLISKCWNYKPNERPSFSEIVETIKRKNFKLINGAERKLDEIKAFLSL